MRFRKVVFQIIEFVFPPLKLAKAAKVGDIATTMEKLFSGVFKAAGIVIDASKKGATKIADLFFELIQGFIKTMKKGTATGYSPPSSISASCSMI